MNIFELLDLGINTMLVAIICWAAWSMRQPLDTIEEDEDE